MSISSSNSPGLVICTETSPSSETVYPSGTPPVPSPNNSIELINSGLPPEIQLSDDSSHSDCICLNENGNMSESESEMSQSQWHCEPILSPPMPYESITIPDSDMLDGSSCFGFPNYPKGLEYLWRELPSDCSKLICQHDVTELAQSRGYFTVGELLELKRVLTRRFLTVYSQNLAEFTSKSEPDINASDVRSYLVKGTTGDMVVEPLGAGASDLVAIRTTFNGNLDHEGSTTTNVSQTQSADISVPIPVPVPIGSPPPYRTTTLVFKIFKIGNYYFKSFSSIHPNTCKFLFNSQRVYYQCHLPVLAPNYVNTFEPFQKLLTMEIEFRQIKMIQFGKDKVFLRVEGPPNMSITYIPVSAEEKEKQFQAPTPEDEYLLNEIEEGNIRLSPFHQLYFLNERLVQMLHMQLKEHHMFHRAINEIQESQH